MSLFELASLILILNQAPISRVRFAKTIYFVHKELIRKKLMRPEDIAYRRLPLGPAPEGFVTLTTDYPLIQIQQSPEAGLFYESEEYVLTLTPPGLPKKYAKFRPTTQRILKLLKLRRTSDLVVASQSDPSWISHVNGTNYYITPADLKNVFPRIQIKINLRLKAPSEVGLLQAKLLHGMLHDIVKESTDLEYPDEGKGNPQESQDTKWPQDSQSSQGHQSFQESQNSQEAEEKPDKSASRSSITTESPAPPPSMDPENPAPQPKITSPGANS